MGIENGQALTDHEVIEQCKVLQKYWREDNHAVINHFIRRCSSGDLFQAEFQWQNSPFGYRQRKVVLVTHAKMHALYSDKFIMLCNLTLEKRIKDPRTIVTMDKVSLSDHLSSGRRKDKMTESEKVHFTNLEFYPALPEEDPRKPDENKLNIYRGMDFPPHFAKQWFHNLPAHEKAKVEEQIQFIDDHFRYLIAAGNNQDHDFFVKWLASKYLQPWIKQDTQIVIRGHKGAGKSEFITTALTKIMGMNHCVRITDINHLTAEFNADTKECLILI
jgi:hypothetical protein